MKYIIIIIGLLLFCIKSYAQNFQIEISDSIVQVNNLFGGDSDNIKINSRKECYYYDTGYKKEYRNYVEVCNNNIETCLESLRFDSAYHIALILLDRVKDKSLHDTILLKTYLNIGRALMHNKKHQWATEYFNKCVEVFNSYNIEKGSFKKNKFLVYYNKGLNYNNYGEYDSALLSYNKALQVASNTHGLHHKSVAFIYFNIGNLYIDKQDYDKALEYYDESLSIYLLYGLSVNIGYIYNGLGIISQEKGDYNKALDYYNKTLSIYNELFDSNNPEFIIIYNNIGELYLKLKKYNEALENYNKTLSLLTEYYGINSPYITFIYENMGSLYESLDKYDTALSLYKQVLALRIKVLDKNHYSIAQTYYNIGNIYLKTNKFINAIQCFQKAIIINCKEFTDTNIYSNPGLSQLQPKFDLLDAINKKAEAFYRYYSNSTKAPHDILVSHNTYYLSTVLINMLRNSIERQKSKFIVNANYKFLYNDIIRTCIEISGILKEKSYEKQAFEFSEEDKGVVLYSSIVDLKAKKLAGIPDSLLEGEKNLKNDIIFYNIQIEKIRDQSSYYDTVVLKKYENIYFSLTQKYDSLIAYFEREYPHYYNLKYQTKTTSVKEVQQHLDSATALLEYFIGDSVLYIFSLTNQTYNIATVLIDSNFEGIVKDYYKSIRLTYTKEFVQKSIILYNKLILPISHYIANKHKIIIIPDEYLYYLPFETLITGDTSGFNEINYNKLNYLIKDYQISYNYSATLWINNLLEKRILPKNDFIGFAPVFSDKEGYIKVTFSDTINTNLRSLAVNDKRFKTLPYTSEEINTIFTLFKQNHRTAKGYFYSTANKSNFLNDISDFKYVHVATHGFIDDEHPDLSGLAFAQIKDTLNDQLSDNILYTEDMYNLNLNADLVVLSACETGIGKLIKGEGLMAMARGFIYSGTPNIIFSLWKVSDKNTKDLMIEFYKSVLNNNTYSYALRSAKLKLIQNEKTALPYLWSSFLLIGK